jgi:nucleoid-associated protein YgaU
MEPNMRNTLLSGAVLAAVLTGGCQPQKPAQTTNIRPTALDVSGPALSATPTYQPAPVTPPAEATVTQTSFTPSSAGGNYTVKKGDTLYRIAKDKYGSGNQWQRIASANPGVSPSTLRVGQTLVIPQ